MFKFNKASLKASLAQARAMRDEIRADLAKTRAERRTFRRACALYTTAAAYPEFAAQNAKLAGRFPGIASDKARDGYSRFLESEIDRLETELFALCYHIDKLKARLSRLF